MIKKGCGEYWSDLGSRILSCKCTKWSPCPKCIENDAQDMENGIK
jgi:hypothetical protein